MKKSIISRLLAFVLVAGLITTTSMAQETSGSFTKGAIKIGYDNRICDASLEGSVRYNSSSSAIEFCDSSVWSIIEPAAGPSPDGWTFIGSQDSTYAGTCTTCDTTYDIPAEATQFLVVGTSDFSADTSWAVESSDNTVMEIDGSCRGNMNCDLYFWPPVETGAGTTVLSTGGGGQCSTIIDSSGNIYYTDNSTSADCVWGYYYK